MGIEIANTYSFALNMPWEQQNRDGIFKGPLADWAREQRESGVEQVEPMHLYFGSLDGQPHTAAWLFRSAHREDGQPPWFFHVACDCMPEADTLDEPDIMYGCEVLAQALIQRAASIGRTVIDTTIEQSVINALERDREESYKWVANYISGQHEVSMLSLLIERPVDDVAEVAADLSHAGLLDFDGESLRLAA